MVRSFCRYHKYSIGEQLRATALRLCQSIHRAVSRKHSHIKLVQQVAELVDDLKLQIQLAWELKASANLLMAWPVCMIILNSKNREI